MSDLIVNFIEDHKIILDALNSSKALKINTPQGRKELEKARNTLLNHLKQEDELMYPELFREAGRNENLKTILDIFAREMDEITGFAVDFFNKAASGADNLDYMKKFGRLTALLKDRMRKEETLLYKEYEKIMK